MQARRSSKPPRIVYTGNRKAALCCGALGGHYKGERCPKDGRIVGNEASLSLQHDRLEAELLLARLSELRNKRGDDL